jgi:hypothetical protein
LATILKIITFWEPNISVLLHRHYKPGY